MDFEHDEISGDHYHDLGNKPCTLLELIRQEPEWAATRIKQGEFAEKKLAALSQPVAGVVESLALADKLYEAADALDAWLSTDDNFEGDVPDDVWVPLQKAMQDYEKSSRIAPAPAVEPCSRCCHYYTGPNPAPSICDDCDIVFDKFEPSTGQAPGKA